MNSGVRARGRYGIHQNLFAALNMSSILIGDEVMDAGDTMIQPRGFLSTINDCLALCRHDTLSSGDGKRDGLLKDGNQEQCILQQILVTVSRPKNDQYQLPKSNIISQDKETPRMAGFK